MRELVVIFEGIDDMNRPIFINPQTLGRYGDTDNLFNLYCTEQEVIDFYRKQSSTTLRTCITYFGRRFGC